MAKILWVSVEVPDRNGQGGQRRQYHQIRALGQRGHEVTVMIPRSAQDDQSIREIARVTRPRISIHGRFMRALLFRTRRQIEGGNWDAIIVAHQGSSHLLPLPHRRSVPVLVDIHNVYSHWYRSMGDEAAARRAHAEEQQALRGAAAVTTCSLIECERLVREHPEVADRVFPAPLGIDPVEWPEQEFDRTEPITVLFGSWSWPPNINGLVWFLNDVWPRVRATLPEAMTYVAGTGVDGALDWPDGVQFVGRVQSLAVFMARASVVAVPVLNGVGASVKFAEALAGGGAVIATSDAASAFPTAPAFISNDAAVWAEWIVERLQRRREESAPAAARSYALNELTWSAAVAPIDEWLSSIRRQRS